MPRTRTRQPVENDVYARFVRRVLTAYGRRIGAGDIEALPELAALKADLDATLVDAVRQLHGEPWNYTWDKIGKALGMTRQQAWRDYHEKIGQ